MVSVQPLEQVGYEPSFFQLPPQEDQATPFTYYTFSDTRPDMQPGYWDLIGLHLREEDAWQLDVHLLHIEEEAFDWKEFQALRDADGFLFLNALRLQALLNFFEYEVGHFSSESEGDQSHFRLMEAEELISNHMDRFGIEESEGNYYRYLPDENIQSAEHVSIIGFPYWVFKQEKYSRSELAYATFPGHNLDDPRFYPFEGEWRGFMTFDQCAWQEFVSLLKQRAI